MIFATKIKVAAALCVATTVAGFGTAQIAQRVTTQSDTPQSTLTQGTITTTTTRQLIATDLGDGVQVQFVGASPYPSNGDDWYGLDGKPIPRPTDGQMRLGTERGRAHQFFFTVGCPADVGVSYSVLKAYGLSSSSPGRDQGLYRVLMCAALPEDAQTAGIEVRIADGPWQTLQQHGPTGIMATSVRNTNMTFTPLNQRDDGAVMYVTTSRIDGQTRLMYTDILGQTHQSKSTGSAGTGELTTTEYHFDTPANQIMQVEFQTRPYNKKVTAKNLTLDPAKPTQPEIVVERN